MDKEKKSGPQKGAEQIGDREPQGQQKARSKPQKAPIEGKPTRSAPTVEEPQESAGARESGDRGAELTRRGSGAGKRSGEEKDREIEGAKSLQAGGNSQGEKDGLLDKLDSTKKRRLLQHYINSGGQVYKSCRFAGIHPQTHYNWLANDPDYKAAYLEAQERSLDVIEQEIIRRGVKGYKEPIIYQGQVTGYIRRFSDNLLMFLAKRRDPMYRDNPQVALGLKAGGDIKISLSIPRPEDQAIDAEAREIPEK